MVSQTFYTRHYNTFLHDLSAYHSFKILYILLNASRFLHKLLHLHQQIFNNTLCKSFTNTHIKPPPTSPPTPPPTPTPTPFYQPNQRLNKLSQIPTQHGMTGMLWASWFGHVNILQFLMKKGSNVSVTNMVGSDGERWI